MILSKVAIFIGSFLSLALFLFHAKLHRLFGWQGEFTKISMLNGKVIYTVNLALTLLFLLFSIISFIYFNELARCDGLAFGLCLGLTLFWVWRLVWQFFYFKWVISGISMFLVGSFLLLSISYFIPVLVKVFGK
jgi:hypothetical protein